MLSIVGGGIIYIISVNGIRYVIIDKWDIINVIIISIIGDVMTDIFPWRALGL